jgi:Ca-activated chloride channel family protein
VTFLAPGRLWLLAGVAALAAAYLVLERRRRHYALRFTNLDLLASVAPRRPGWRRHLPAAAMALALATIVVGLARPARDERVPRDEATVMLAVDTSVSMNATDVAPTRMQAAVAAAREFVDELPARFRLGLVAFDQTARVLAPPTTDRVLVRRWLERLAPGPGTAAGEAVFAALDAIAASRSGPPSGGEAPAAAIVLLSDGVTTVGRPAEVAAYAAADQAVPVSTIAFGSDAGTIELRGRTVRVPADRETMTEVAETTGGDFFEAASGEELRTIYGDIGTRVGYTTERREIGMALVGGAAGLLFAALAAALVWTGRVL